MSRTTLRAAAGILLSTAGAGSAEAHIVSARLGDFYAGALHPFTDLQDVLAWAALGLLAATTGHDRGRWLILTVPLGLLAGFSVAPFVLPGTVGAGLSAALLLVLGLLLAANVRLRTSGLAAVAFGIAAVRGAANADGLSAEVDHILFAAGLAMAGYVAITLMTAVTDRFLRPDARVTIGWRRIAVRACGSWIAAIGLMVGGLALVH